MTPSAVTAPEKARFLPVSGGLRGSVRLPGDKSISHRAVLLGAVNSGPVRISDFLLSQDTLATVRAVRALGVRVEEKGNDLVVHGAGWEGLGEPEDVIDVGNSGTLIRLLPGLVAARDIMCVMTGDASIRRRPMSRILAPLSRMGVAVDGRQSGSLPPISVRGGSIHGTRHELEVASAQVKSCLLLAGLQADGPTSVWEPGASRDHTERMIAQGGGSIEREEEDGGAATVTVWPVDKLDLRSIAVPGDFSSAAFLLVAAAIVPGSQVTVEGVGLNPTRVGLLDALIRMGADISIKARRTDGEEPVGDITARYSELISTDVEPSEIPTLIDELPAFMLAAARARGRSVIRGARELRVKESDRLSAMASLLTGLGIKVVEHDDGLEIEGDPEGWSGGEVRASADHRLAMTGAIAGCASSTGVTIDDVGCISVSYPGFIDTLAELGGQCEQESTDSNRGAHK